MPSSAQHCKLSFDAARLMTLSGHQDLKACFDRKLKRPSSRFYDDDDDRRRRRNAHKTTILLLLTIPALFYVQVNRDVLNFC